MVTKLVIYVLGIIINLYVANKKQGPMKRMLYIVAALWGLIGILDISGVL